MSEHDLAGCSELRVCSVREEDGISSCVCAWAVTTEDLDRQSEAMSDSVRTHDRMLEARPVVFEIHHRKFAQVWGHPTAGVPESSLAAQ
jgi:hypothetical protein